MKLFDYIKRAQTNQAKPDKQSPLAKKIVAMYYADYPETPYISADRKSDWLEMAALFPKTVPVKKEMTLRFAASSWPCVYAVLA